MNTYDGPVPASAIKKALEAVYTQLSSQQEKINYVINEINDLKERLNKSKEI